MSSNKTTTIECQSTTMRTVIEENKIKKTQQKLVVSPQKRSNLKKKKGKREKVIR